MATKPPRTTGKPEDSKRAFSSSIQALSKTVRAAYAIVEDDPYPLTVPTSGDVRTFLVCTWLGALTRETYSEPWHRVTSIHGGGVSFADMSRHLETVVNRLPEAVRRDLPIYIHSTHEPTLNESWFKHVRDVSPVSLVRQGYETLVAETLSSVLQLRTIELLTTLGIPERTVARRLKEDKRLTTEESDRLYRALDVMRSSVEVFGDLDLATKWLKEPNPSLNGVTPLSLLDTQPGRDQVATLLGRLDHGVYG